MGEAALAREFERNPPREELDSIKALWRDYMWRYVEAGRGDPCVPYTAKAQSLTEAIRRACDSRGEDGKMFFHQGRVWQWNRDAYRDKLLKKRWFRFLEDAKDFEDIFRICNEVGQKTPGIGRVTIYDVTSRLAAWWGYEAEWLHFHAGVLEGLKALSLYYGFELDLREGKIHRSCLEPRFLRKQNMDLAESFLCGYRSEIQRVLSRKGDM